MRKYELSYFKFKGNNANHRTCDDCQWNLLVLPSREAVLEAIARVLSQRSAKRHRRRVVCCKIQSLFRFPSYSFAFFFFPTKGLAYGWAGGMPRKRIKQPTCQNLLDVLDMCLYKDFRLKDQLGALCVISAEMVRSTLQNQENL